MLWRRSVRIADHPLQSLPVLRSLRAALQSIISELVQYFFYAEDGSRPQLPVYVRIDIRMPERHQTRRIRGVSVRKAWWLRARSSGSEQILFRMHKPLHACTEWVKANILCKTAFLCTARDGRAE